MSRPLTADVSQTVELFPEVFHRPVRRRLIRWAQWTGFALFTIYCLHTLGFFDLERLLRGTQKLFGVVSFMLPPASHGRTLEFIRATLETLGMAFLGTLLASLASVPLGFLGAKNVIGNPVFHFGLRRFVDFLRGVDALIWALVWINVVGLGPFAGILAIAVSNTGELSKLFSEAIENVDRKPMEGVRASGANAVQTMRYAILPQVFPVMLSNSLYYFESNTRSATILGIVGAGGIGLQLADRIRVMAWDQVSLLIIMILITVYAIDTVSSRVRQHFIQAPEVS
ncbi:MAG TPA: phosphonate ABC transporter, permease protein PhnE [Desulfobacterales bacterium]